MPAVLAGPSGTLASAALYAASAFAIAAACWTSVPNAGIAGTSTSRAAVATAASGAAFASAWPSKTYGS
jgi:hypothetical protein